MVHDGSNGPTLERQILQTRTKYRLTNATDLEFNYEANSRQPRAGTFLNASRPTEFPLIPPPPPPRCRKWVFSPRAPGRAIQVPTPPILRMLNSIMGLILINQVPGHLKMRFSGSKLTEFPLIPTPPPTVQKMSFFTPRARVFSSSSAPDNCDAIGSAMAPPPHHSLKSSTSSVAPTAPLRIHASLLVSAP